MRAVTLLGLALAFSSGLPAAQPDEFDGVRERIRDAIAEESLPSISVAVARGGKVLWEEGFGWADVAKRIPATADTVYSLASISKPITATGLMVLVERGKIDLDAPMGHYLGKARLTARVGNAKDATVRRVANHTSGLSVYYQFFYEDEAVPLPTMEESIRRNGILVQKPGESMVYSNFGYGLLEYAIEQVSGKRYAQFMLEEVFQPLGLSHTAINREPDFGAQVAVRHARNGAPVPFYDFDHRGASAVFSSAHDLVRFGMYHLKNRIEGQKAILEDASLDEMHRATTQSEDSGYGIGFGTGKRFELATFGHTGGMAGVSTRLTLVPERDIAIVLLANADSGELRGIENEILHVLQPETIRIAHGFKPAPEWLGAWRGAVETPAGRTPVHIDIESTGRVVAQVGTRKPEEVVHVTLAPDGVLWLEEVHGDVGTKEAARYPYRLQFALRSRGDVMNGAATAMSRPLTGRVGNAITYFVELKKTP